jgi:hypothetical protein
LRALVVVVAVAVDIAIVTQEDLQLLVEVPEVVVMAAADQTQLLILVAGVVAVMLALT